MWISGPESGISEVSFDWCEEPDACFDCRPAAYENCGRLTWACDYCGGGSAALMPVTGAGHPNERANKLTRELF